MLLPSTALANPPTRGLSKVWGDRVEMRFGKPFDVRNLDRDSTWRRSIAEDQAGLSAKFLENSDRRSACPLCGAPDSSDVLTVHGVVYAECMGCTHLYSRLAPATQAVQKLYELQDGATAASSQSKIYLDDELFIRRTSLIGRPKVDFVTAVIGSCAGEWLDVGCGTGEVLSAAAQAGWRTRGIEADARFVQFARQRGIEVDQAFVTQDTSGSLMRHASVVSLFNVIEHIEDPASLLAAIAKGVRPGTWLVVEVPRHPSLSSLSNLLYPDMSARHICPPDHLHVFTDKSLLNMLQKVRVEPKALWFFGQDFQDLVMTGLSSALGSLPTPAFVEALLSAAPAIQQSIDESGLSDTVLMVGRFGTPTN